MESCSYLGLLPNFTCCVIVVIYGISWCISLGILLISFTIFFVKQMEPQLLGPIVASFAITALEEGLLPSNFTLAHWSCKFLQNGPRKDGPFCQFFEPYAEEILGRPKKQKTKVGSQTVATTELRQLTELGLCYRLSHIVGFGAPRHVVNHKWVLDVVGSVCLYID